MKTCFKCNKEQPLTEFYKHHQMKDGYLNKCKSCTKYDTIKNREEKIDQYSQYEKKRSSLPHRVTARKEYAKTEQGRLASNRAKYKWRKNNYNKFKAYWTVQNALVKGILHKQPCEKCSNIKSEAHHHDYSKPLDVIWLCDECHKSEHRSLKE